MSALIRHFWRCAHFCFFFLPLPPPTSSPIDSPLALSCFLSFWCNLVARIWRNTRNMVSCGRQVFHRAHTVVSERFSICCVCHFLTTCPSLGYYYQSCPLPPPLRVCSVFAYVPISGFYAPWSRVWVGGRGREWGKREGRDM